MALRIDHLNKKLATLGDIELVKGEGYFYFINKLGDELGASVMVDKLNQLPETEWLELAQEALNVTTPDEESEEEESEEEESEEEGNKMSGTIQKYREAYVKTVSYSGNNSLDNGDDVAEVLRGLSPDETCALADKVFEAPAFHHAERWQHLNAGSRRMNAGNRIRAAFKRGEVTAQQLRDYADHKDIKLDEGEV